MLITKRGILLESNGIKKNIYTITMRGLIPDYAVRILEIIGKRCSFERL